VIPFFRKQVAGKTGITTTETEVDGTPYFVVSAEGHKLPFSALAIMKTPDALKPASGEWVQISISK
jgi:FlaA1/EpsC-like NDP-sugar epimerase